VELDSHFFRQEAGRVVASLTRVFGVRNLALAEDVTQDALCRALEVWKFSGLPKNPSAWLMAAAKRRAIDVFRRERTARTFEPELSRQLESEWTLAPSVAELFAESAVKDDVLRMMFMCCQDRLPEQAQIMLILHTLCGFSVGEVAGAFLSSPAAVEKRLIRAKKVLAKTPSLFELTEPKQVSSRLCAVQRALYLLFNEGYHGSSAEHPVAAELCAEAIRLARLLVGPPLAPEPSSRALLALMCLNAARLPGRLDAEGNLTPLESQDRSRWDRKLLDEGLALLDQSARGEEVSEYHLEAAISAVHAQATRAQDTDWPRIVSLYDVLHEMRPTPVVAMNRAIAIAQAQGPERGLEALQAIANRKRLGRYPFFAAALGELELRVGQREQACAHFRQAQALARSPMEQRFFAERARIARGVA
jgi:RNA polymerase sigma factor (sigma-70 family)